MRDGAGRMVNEAGTGKRFIRKKIFEENLAMLMVGIAVLVGSLILTFILWEIGFIFSLFFAGILIGSGMILYSIFAIVYLPANRIYRNWKVYGGNDTIIEEIQKIISSEKKEFESNQSILSKGWLIKPKEFIFVKTSDVNWIHLLNEGGFFDSNIFHQKIKVFTKIGIKFEINCGDIPKAVVKQQEDAVTANVYAYMDALHGFCKNAIIGYNPKFEKIWKKSPEKFYENVGKLETKTVFGEKLNKEEVKELQYKEREAVRIREERDAKDVVLHDKESKKAPPPGPKTLKGKMGKAIYDVFPNLPRRKKKGKKR